ncbi:SpoIIE family protein phosphatase, partial [candidate division KSB1 bacterium]|nr:SpoIIE family protein phosphatase [candidate division KSB1 bacterium]
NVHLVKIRPDLIVYDINAPILDLDGRIVGLIHLWIDQNYIERLISSKRLSDLTNSLFAMIGGYIVIVIFVYMVMTPFQRLTEWVRAQGQGGEIQDQIDITDSGEIGEIAKAFSDITTKFKDSQKKLVRQEQLQKEMQVAKEIQQTLLPTEFPKLESYGIDAYYEAAKEVGGDYFDFVNVDDDTLGIVVADVSGKGIPGSLVMTMIRTALRTEARGILNSSEVLAKVNSFVVNDMKKGMFVTVFYAIIDAKRRRINFCCAGHNPMILYRGSTKKTYFLKPHGFPIGISLPDMNLFAKSLEMDNFQLIEDDILIFYTDGITEAMNRKRQMYGEERLLQIIRENASLPVKPLIEKIKDDVHSFTEGFPQSDDITLVVIKEESSAERQELKRAVSAHRLILAGKSIRAACEQAGITTYAYYNKYKQKFESEGLENIEPEDESAMLESKHLSIEEKTKIYEIIRVHVDYGPRRISEELDTEKYGFTKIPEAKIYEELVRSRLNTKQLREAFLQRNKRAKRVKPPGTPFLTMDGEVIIDKTPIYEPSPEEDAPELAETKAAKTPPTEGTVNKVVGEDVTFLPPIENLLEKSGVDPDEKRSTQQSPTRPTLLKTPITVTAVSEESEPIIEEELLKSTPPSGQNEKENDSIAGNEFQIDEPHLAVDEMLNKNEMFFQHGEFEGDEAERNGQEAEFEGNIADSNHQILTKSENQAEKAPQNDLNIESIHLADELSFSAVDEILQQESPWNGNSSTLYEEITESKVDESEHTSEIYEQDISNLPGVKPASPPPTGNKPETGIKYTEVLTQLDEEISALMENKPVDAEPEELYDFEYENSAADETAVQSRNAFYEMPEDSSSGINVEISYKKLLLKGLSYYRKGAYDQAIDTLNIIVARYPELKEAHIILGNAYFRNRMFEQAATEYYKVKSLDPGNLDAYENMGVIYANSGEYKKAIEEWQHILQINPKRYDIRKNIERAVSLIS